MGRSGRFPFHIRAAAGRCGQPHPFGMDLES